MQNYNFFYNNVRLLTAKYEHNHQTKTQTENCFLFNNSLDLTKLFSGFLSENQDIDLFYKDEKEEKQIREALLDFFIFRRAAGGIVFKKDALLCIFRFDCWDFPKGHVEAGETDVDAALRETAEETGIENLTIEKDLDFTYHIFKDSNDQFILKQTHWFQMRTSSEKMLVPQTEEGILTAEWIPFSQRHRIIENTYPSIVELLERVKEVY
jgi:8-oxo-dGTP pyrophosphatase MutT (NUDIX family)